MVVFLKQDYLNHRIEKHWQYKKRADSNRFLSRNYSFTHQSLCHICKCIHHSVLANKEVIICYLNSSGDGIWKSGSYRHLQSKFKY